MSRTGRISLWAGLLLFALAACSGAPAPATQAPRPTNTDTETLAPLGGTGLIVFGTAYDADTLAITGQKSSFKASSKKIAWSASLSKPAGALSMTLVLASHRSSGAEVVLIREEVDVSNPDNDLFANALDLSLLVDRKPGTYVMRYIHDSDVLAEGTFTLVK